MAAGFPFAPNVRFARIVPGRIVDNRARAGDVRFDPIYPGLVRFIEAIPKCPVYENPAERKSDISSVSDEFRIKSPAAQ